MSKHLRTRLAQSSDCRPSASWLSHSDFASSPASCVSTRQWLIYDCVDRKQRNRAKRVLWLVIKGATPRQHQLPVTLYTFSSSFAPGWLSNKTLQRFAIEYLLNLDYTPRTTARKKLRHNASPMHIRIPIAPERYPLIQVGTACRLLMTKETMQCLQAYITYTTGLSEPILLIICQTPRMS